MHEEINTKPIADLPPPNKFPDRPDRFPFSMTLDFVAGETAHKASPGIQPCVQFRPDHLVSNVRAPGILFLEELLMGNIQANIGVDGIDMVCAPDHEDGILGAPFHGPWISPSNRIMMKVRYNGRIPPGMRKGDPFTVAVTLVGQATCEPYNYTPLGDSHHHHVEMKKAIEERNVLEEKLHKEMLEALAALKASIKASK